MLEQVPDLFHGHLLTHNPLLAFVCQLICQVINYQAKTKKVWALPISLATTLGIVIYFLFLCLLRCFSSAGSLSITLYIQVTVTRHDSSWVSPFGYFRIKACMTAPRNFSQSSTSFIGILCQGIHLVPLSNFLCIGRLVVGTYHFHALGA